MTQARANETRNHILDAALRRFSKDGYDAASVDEICAQAGVSKGAFYHHFPSKQAIFLALLERWLATVEAGLESMRKPTIPETLIQMTDALPLVFASAENRLPLFLEFWVQANRDKAVWKASIAPYRHYRDFFERLVAQGIAEGTLKAADPKATAQVILSMGLGLLLQGVLDPRGADWPKVSRESMRILLNGLVKA